MNRLKLFYILAVLIFFWSCDGGDWSKPPEDVKGYKPVYIPKTEAYTVSVKAPRDLEKPGKIYIYQTKLFVIERLKGVHVFDNANPANPVPLAFVSIPGCNDVAVNKGILYADNVDDLVALDITDISSIKLVNRIPGQFPNGVRMYPEQARNQYFECVDTTKGIVIDWEYTTLKDPKCYR